MSLARLPASGSPFGSVKSGWAFRSLQNPSGPRLGDQFTGQEIGVPNVGKRAHAHIVRSEDIDHLLDAMRVLRLHRVAINEHSSPTRVEVSLLLQFERGGQSVGGLAGARARQLNQAGEFILWIDVADALVMSAESGETRAVVDEAQTVHFGRDDLLVSDWVDYAGQFGNDLAVNGVAVLENDDVAPAGQREHRDEEHGEREAPTATNKRTAKRGRSRWEHGLILASCAVFHFPLIGAIRQAPRCRRAGIAPQ